jgi:predicted metal-binding membrane protein
VTTVFESILKRDRWTVATALVLVSLLAWTWLLSGAGMGMDAFEMTRHGRMGMDMMDKPVWTIHHIIMMFFMWWIMMIAMMLPSASPTILLAAALNRRSTASSPPFGSTGLFVAGYLLAWAGFSVIAVTAQWWMQDNGWLNNMLISQSRFINGLLLLAAGLWQFSPWKYTCLKHCKSPVEFLTSQRRGGRSSALQMGLIHGGYCLGCCWFLMALLFVGGVMDLYWIIGLTIYVWIEKILPGGETISRLMGGLLALWGLGVLTGIF